jgi:hypothetical protein
MAGVSTDINATFVKPGGKLGDTVFMETRVIGIGEQYFSWTIRQGSVRWVTLRCCLAGNVHRHAFLWLKLRT